MVFYHRHRRRRFLTAAAAGLSLPLETCIFQLTFVANTAAAAPHCKAVALAEQSAANVSFQRQQASAPPTQNVNSAPRSRTSAMQFSGSIANCAEFAAFTAIRPF